MRKAMMWIVMGLPTVGAAEEVVIAALGDSLTQGFGLVQEEGFVPQLQAWLDAKGIDARLINAGVSGDTTAGGLSRVAWTLTPEVDAVILALGGNDLLRGIAPEVSRANLNDMLQQSADADVQVLLIGMKAPGNYGPDYKQAFDSIYPQLAAQHDILLAEDFFAGLNVENGDPASVQVYMQPDGIHPNAAGVAKIVEALGPYVAELASRVDG